MGLSISEENYLKAIYKICEKQKGHASTNEISQRMETAPASVTDMLKRLSEKELIHYKRYRGVSLTESGKEVSTRLIRKHRLWETFLSETLRFRWDEVHEIAEQLEHIRSDNLIDRLEEFLGHPRFDPHGDPIPDKTGKYTLQSRIKLSKVAEGTRVKIVGVGRHDNPFLKHLSNLGLEIGSELTILEAFDYDGSCKIEMNEQGEALLSKDTSDYLLVQKVRD